MTVAELIKELEKIENKELDVVSVYGDVDDCVVTYVEEGYDHYRKEEEPCEMANVSRRCIRIY